MEKEFSIVWLEEERTFAELTRMDAHFSVVRFQRDGETVEMLIENDEYSFRGDDVGDSED